MLLEGGLGQRIGQRQARHMLHKPLPGVCKQRWRMVNPAGIASGMQWRCCLKREQVQACCADARQRA
ncbi:hypothetical protein QY702_19540 [Xanthomonas campestris pv. plantaginis]|uniref:hypothetical protein n=1 Tax=Xanthomonas campestris TaxID=339 RepID=UPI002B232D29|nr:hypothetical protein [Xanthomonas campestris]MEA9608561.1 hypothetical protein [Xanthomonas campestris pv. plantaginis]